MIPAVGGLGGYGSGKGFVLAEELRAQLSHLRHQKALIVKLVCTLQDSSWSPLDLAHDDNYSAHLTLTLTCPSVFIVLSLSGSTVLIWNSCVQVDIVDFNGSFLTRVRDLVGANPIIMVLTKVHLLTCSPLFALHREPAAYPVRSVSSNVRSGTLDKSILINDLLLIILISVIFYPKAQTWLLLVIGYRKRLFARSSSK